MDPKIEIEQFDDVNLKRNFINSSSMAFKYLLGQANNKMKGQKIRREEVEKLVVDFNGRVDWTILDSIPYEPYGKQEFYRLSGNRILFKLDEGDGVLYNSLKDIIEIYSTDWVARIPKADEKFITQITALVMALSDTLKLNLKMSDRLDHLAKLDSAIRVRGGITSVNVEEHLLPLVAYCGQIIVNETGGVWEVLRENEGEAQLFVNGPDEKLYDPYNPVLKEITGASNEFSFAGIIQQVISHLNSKLFKAMTIKLIISEPRRNNHGQILVRGS